jgi:CrcB protein
MTAHNFLLVAAGGGCGAMARYFVSTKVQSLAHGSAFPLGTFAANALGCLAIGVLAAVADDRGTIPPSLRLLLGVGFLGGFTTFSTFGFEAFELLRRGWVGLAALHVLGQVTVGIGAVALGYWLARTV